MANDTTLAFTGNCYLQQRVSAYREEGFLKMVELMRGADVTFTNLEFCIQEGEDFPAFVAGNGRGATYMMGPPYIVDELKWMGIDMVYAANNHSADFAEGGVTTTIRHLKERGMPYAGLGANLTDASTPGYLETAKGRVALIAVSDWGPRGRADLPFQWPAAVMPADEGPMFKGRPGVNLLRYDIVNTVDQEGLDALRRLSNKLEWEEAKASRREGGGRAEAFIGESIFGGEQDTDTEFHFMGRKFKLGDKFDFYTEPYKSDLERNYKWIQEARRHADWVVVGLHDQGARRPFDEEHSKVFARGSIDAGADIYLNHGAKHGGIEIYKGKVILYGQPSWYLQNEQVRRVPLEMMNRWGLDYDNTAADFLEARQSGEGRAGGPVVGRAFAGVRGGAIHVIVYNEDRQLKEVQIHPLAALSGSRSERGRPLLAEPGSDVSKAVIQRAAEMSEPFGTKVEVRDGIGVVRP